MSVIRAKSKLRNCLSFTKIQSTTFYFKHSLLNSLKLTNNTEPHITYKLTMSLITESMSVKYISMLLG